MKEQKQKGPNAMDNEPKTVSVAYTKLENGHGFKAADKSTKWLLVTHHDLESAIEEVSEQLSEILGGEWHPTEETKNLLKGKNSEGASKPTAPFPGLAGVTFWTNEKVAA